MSGDTKKPMGCGEFTLWLFGWLLVPWLAFLVLLCVNQTAREITGTLLLIAIALAFFAVVLV